jgi:hypothetical protein
MTLENEMAELLLEEFSGGDPASCTLIGSHALVTPEGEVHLTLRYGPPMAPDKMTFRMTTGQADRVAKGLLCAWAMAGNRLKASGKAR